MILEVWHFPSAPGFSAENLLYQVPGNPGQPDNYYEIVNMRLSKQLHVTRLAEGWNGVYSPFGQRVAFLFDEAWENLTAGNFQPVSPKILDYLKENNILVDDGFEEKWVRENRSPADVCLNSMYLVVTQNCNLGCKYCAVVENLDSSDRMKETMSLEVGRQAVDFFERQLNVSRPRDARVTFYGGEPMLNQELIFDLVPRIREIKYLSQDRPVEVVMITNGYLYNPEIIELFKEHKVGVCISLDGSKRFQDITRVTRYKGESTFDRVIENYYRYKDAGLSMGISTALGRHNAFDLPEICEFYAQLGAPFVEFQIPYQVSNESNEFWVSTEEISQNLMQAYGILKSHGIIEGTTYRRLRDFSGGRVHLRDCGSSGSQLVVAPDGSIGPCHSLVGTRTFFEGNVNDESSVPREMDNFLEWAKRFPMNMPECSDCSYISLCGGGCIYNSYISNGTIWGKDPQVCTYMKEMIDWILRDLWHDSGMAQRYGTFQPE